MSPGRRLQPIWRTASLAKIRPVGRNGSQRTGLGISHPGDGRGIEIRMVRIDHVSALASTRSRRTRVDARAKRDFTPTASGVWPRPSAIRIGKQSFCPQHIRSRRDVIAKMQRVIENANLMTPARKEMFAGMYFQCAERVADRVSRKRHGRSGRMLIAPA